MISGLGGSSNLVFRFDFVGDLVRPAPATLLELDLFRLCVFTGSEDFVGFFGNGLIVCSCGSMSCQWPGPFIVINSPSKSSSYELLSFLPSFTEAKALRRSLDSRPPKLSCGLRCGSCSALGEIAVAKSSSQLSSSVIRLGLGRILRHRDFNAPASSGLLKAPAPGRSFASDRPPLAGVPPRNLDEGPASEPVDCRSLGPEDFRALFHCFTSSTASLKLAGVFDTGASVRRQPVIQA